jgi:hypothetical protein
MTKMTHKLLITLTIEPNYPNEVRDFFQKIVNPNDAVRGVPCLFRLKAKNIGERHFPGGTITVARIIYSGGVYHEAPPSDIPEVPREEVKTILEITTVPMNEGSASIEIEVKAKDGEVVECYQRRLDKPIRTNGWMDVFYVVNREILITLWMLSRLMVGKI